MSLPESVLNIYITFKISKLFCANYNKYYNYHNSYELTQKSLECLLFRGITPIFKWKLATIVKNIYIEFDSMLCITSYSFP